MSKDKRILFASVALSVFTGCHSMVPQSQLRQSQLRTYQVHQQSQMLAGELGQAQMMASQLSAENQQLAMERQRLSQELSVANSRLGNLAQERSKLHDQYKNLLTALPAPESPLGGAANKLLQDLCRRYPNFEFDPVTGVSRFNGDLLFATGSNQIRPEGQRILDEFARIMNNNDTRQFDILVVGHTDDQPVVKAVTRAQHETNWELSAHRATAVVRQLSKYGLAEPRMGVAGYSMHQPATPNANDGARQKNRRVEIYILAPNAAVAGKDPAKQPR